MNKVKRDFLEWCKKNIPDDVAEIGAASPRFDDEVFYYSASRGYSVGYRKDNGAGPYFCFGTDITKLDSNYCREPLHKRIQAARKALKAAKWPGFEFSVCTYTGDLVACAPIGTIDANWKIKIEGNKFFFHDGDGNSQKTTFKKVMKYIEERRKKALEYRIEEMRVQLKEI